METWTAKIADGGLVQMAANIDTERDSRPRNNKTTWPHRGLIVAVNVLTAASPRATTPHFTMNRTDLPSAASFTLRKPSSDHLATILADTVTSLIPLAFFTKSITSLWATMLSG